MSEPIFHARTKEQTGLCAGSLDSVGNFKKSILNAIKQQFHQHKDDIFTDFFDPFILHFLEQVNFEFRIYTIFGSIGFILVIFLFVLNLVFIFWISKRLIRLRERC